MDKTIQAGAVGIDLGSQRSVIAVAKKGGVDVIDNEASYRETRNIVSYGNHERFMGDLAVQQFKSNFKNTVTFFNRLLGISSSYPLLKEETQWISSPVGSDPQGQLYFDVVSQGSKEKFTPMQVTSSMIGKLRQIIAAKNINNTEAVLSVPTYYTEQERKELLDAARIAELNVVRLMNESSAIALGYGIFRKAELDAVKKRNVVFIDFGHSKLCAFLASFTNTKAEVLAQVCERHLGARDIDKTIFKIYAQQFEQKTGLSVYESKKGILRLQEGVERQKKMLSANSDAPCNVEYLVEEEDFNHLLSRKEFEELAAPVLR